MKLVSASVLSQIARPLAEVVVAIGTGLGIGSLLMLIFQYDPVLAYSSLFRGAFGGIREFADTLAFATPLIMTGITFLIAQRAGLFNIGAEGQLYLGSLGAVSASLFTLPAGVHLLLAVAFSAAVGAIWSLPVAVLKVRRGVHEVLSTIMLNWIAFWLTLYLISAALADPRSAERTIIVAQTSRFPILVGGADLTAAIVVSIGFAVFVYYFLWHTRLGYEFRSVGLNPDASRYAGMNQLRVTILAFVLGGVAAGMAGAFQVVGKPPTWALYGTLANVVGLGFNGIGVAMIGRSHPIGAIFAGVFFGGLYTGARLMQATARVPVEMVQAVIGIMVVAVAVPGAIDTIRMYARRRRPTIG